MNSQNIFSYARILNTLSRLFVIPANAQVAAGEIEIQGGIYDLETGHVEFLGRSPAQATLVKAADALPPSLS